jgi:hypothetical protein
MGTGWPFLVAAGRRRDYRTLLAPEPLVAVLDYGVLDEVVRPSGPAPTVVDATTRAGRRISVVFATHLLTPADLGPPGSSAAGVRDEHGRPLRLIYGFVCLDASVGEPAGADLAHARTTALETYRRFLADEDRLTVEASAPFPVRSGTVTRPVAPTAPVGRRAPTVLAGTVAVAVLAVLGAGAAVAWHRPAPAPAACPSAPAGARPPAPAPDRSPLPSGSPLPSRSPLLSGSPLPAGSPPPARSPSCPPAR